MLTRLALAIAMLLWSSPLMAQEIHVTIGQTLTSPVSGCRYTEWLPEGYFGPNESVWLILWNPLPVDQWIEITKYDDGSHSPSYHDVIPAETRTARELFTPGLRALVTSTHAVSVEVRWQHAGSSALASWPLVYDRPLVLSEGKALVLCYDR